MFERSAQDKSFFKKIKLEKADDEEKETTGTNEVIEIGTDDDGDGEKNED